MEKQRKKYRFFLHHPSFGESPVFWRKRSKKPYAKSSANKILFPTNLVFFLCFWVMYISMHANEFENRTKYRVEFKEIFADFSSKIRTHWEILSLDQFIWIQLTCFSSGYFWTGPKLEKTFSWYYFFKFHPVLWLCIFGI